MEKSKVIELLKCMKTNEISDFRKMLVSPYFTRKEVVKTLFEYLIKFHPNFEEEKKLDKAVVFKKVFKENIPSDESLIIKKLKNPSYDLKNLLEEFFILQELKEDKVKKRHLLLSRFYNLNKELLVIKEIELLEKDVQKIPLGEDYFYQKYKLFNIQYLYRKNLKDNTGKLSQLLESLDELKALQFLKFGVESIAKKELFNDEKIGYKLEDFTKIAKKMEASNSILLRMYARLLLLRTTEKTDAYFNKTANYFYTSKTLTQNEQKNIAISLINYTNKKIVKGQSHYTRKFFEVYKFGFENTIFINEDNSIYAVHFRNVVLMGCIVNEFNWVENFIQKNAMKVKESNQKNVKVLGYALLDFHQKNYDKALERSKDVEFKDLFDKILIKNLLTQCYYELSEYSLLDYFSKAYKKFLHTNSSIGEIRKKRILNFITITQKLAKHKATGKPTKHDLINYLSKLKPVAQYDWLFQKIDMLK